MNMYGDTITRVRALETTDKYGMPVLDWAQATRTAFARVAVQPDERTEAIGDRMTVITGLRVITPPGRDIDVTPADRIEYDGRAYGVNGEVARFRLSGRVHHVEVRLRRADG